MKKPKFYKRISVLLISVLFLLITFFPTIVETQAIYTDIGLRVYDGTETVFIAVEPVGTLTSPLRIAKNGTVYGVVLVDPSDFFASKIRIRTNSGIRALAVVYVEATSTTVTPDLIRRSPLGVFSFLITLRLPSGIGKDDVDETEPLILFAADNVSPITFSSSSIVATSQLVSGDATQAKVDANFDTAELMNLIPGYGEKVLRTVGKLKSGQYFYGDAILYIGQFIGP